jgi:hypothetical protein
VGSKLEEVTEKALFSSRWILAPIFLGLSLALLALGVKFFQEAYHLIVECWSRRSRSRAQGARADRHLAGGQSHRDGDVLGLREFRFDDRRQGH